MAYPFDLPTPIVALIAALGGAAAGWLGAGLFAACRRADSARQRAVLADEIEALKRVAAARERAEAASEAKSRFLATVSHEIRTPLSGILGMADLLIETPLAAEQASYVAAIKTSGSALASLIDEILDFSRIEAGKLDLVAEPFDLVALVEGMVELLAPKAQGKGLEIAASVAPDVPRAVVGDGARLRQVLINLAGNAVKFTEAGGVGVRVTRAAGGAVRFAVADTGPGIPPERRAAIFEEFEQGDGSASRRHDGSGLGLTISMHIVERMGGRLQLESADEHGSIFSFDIVLPAADSARETEPPSLAGRRALIVGRSPFEAPYLGDRLADAGAQVTRAEGAEAALALLEKEPPPDIVIVDCALGESATRRLAGAARAAGVARSLVLFSPFERRAFGQNSLEGFDGWLVKPVRSRSLLARLASGGQQTEDEDADTGETKLPSCAGLNVLIAEDNDINALVVQRHLERLGANARRVRDGEEAVAAIAATADGPMRYDVILMDVRMPGLDGLEASRRIRRDALQSGAPRLRIIGLTANVFAEDRAACFAAGFDDFLTKPVDIAALAQAVAKRGQSDVLRALVGRPPLS